MEQQKQTLNYFSENAQDWQRKAMGEAYSTIEDRHNAVLRVMEKLAAGSLLDLGCGTGQLSITASEMGWEALGVDFAPSMIDTCVENNDAAGASAKFKCASIFEEGITDRLYDCVSAQGLIEYLSLEELDTFFDIVKANLSENGVLALGSRNRLFNLHSLNAFTELEQALGTTDRLLEECLVISRSDSFTDAVTELESINLIYDQPQVHPITGIKVDTRYQFTPGDLIARMKKHGLKAIDIYPVHIHGFPQVTMKDERVALLHENMAKHGTNFLQDLYKLSLYSSSFVIAATHS